VDVDDKKLLLLQMDGYKPVNEIYQGYFQIGANDYNGAKYKEALQNFTGALAASSYMNSKAGPISRSIPRLRCMQGSLLKRPG